MRQAAGREEQARVTLPKGQILEEGKRRLPASRPGLAKQMAYKRGKEQPGPEAPKSERGPPDRLQWETRAAPL